MKADKRHTASIRDLATEVQVPVQVWRLQPDVLGSWRGPWEGLRCCSCPRMGLKASAGASVCDCSQLQRCPVPPSADRGRQGLAKNPPGLPGLRALTSCTEPRVTRARTGRLRARFTSLSVPASPVLPPGLPRQRAPPALPRAPTTAQSTNHPSRVHAVSPEPGAAAPLPSPTAPTAPNSGQTAHASQPGRHRACPAPAPSSRAQCDGSLQPIRNTEVAGEHPAGLRQTSARGGAWGGRPLAFLPSAACAHRAGGARAASEPTGDPGSSSSRTQVPADLLVPADRECPPEPLLGKVSLTPGQRVPIRHLVSAQCEGPFSARAFSLPRSAPSSLRDLPEVQRRRGMPRAGLALPSLLPAVRRVRGP